MKRFLVTMITVLLGTVTALSQTPEEIFAKVDEVMAQGERQEIGYFKKVSYLCTNIMARRSAATVGCFFDEEQKDSIWQLK